MEKEILTLYNSLLEVLSQLKGINFQTENYLMNQSKRIEKFFGNIPFSHLSSNLILSDLKAESASKSKQIFLGHSYGVDNKNASTQIESNINFYFALSLSHSYEIFEIFTKRLLRIIYDYDRNTVIEKITDQDLRDRNKDKSIDNLRHSNNDTYFKIFRRILPEVAIIEQSNYRKTNLTEWYQAFSNFRHTITHKNSVCSKEDYKKYKRLSDQYFPVIRHCDSPNCEHLRFQITYDILSENLILIGEYGYLITAELGSKYGFEIKET